MKPLNLVPEENKIKEKIMRLFAIPKKFIGKENDTYASIKHKLYRGKK